MSATVRDRPTPEARLLPPLMLTVSEVARRTGAPIRTVQDWCARGTLPALKVGRFVRVEASALVEFMARHRTGASA